MKHLIIIALLFLHLGIKAQDMYCCPKAWKHTYKKERFKVITKCKTVEGTVEKVEKEADGDVHIRLRLSEKDAFKLTNDKNRLYQKGCLVIEIICTHTPTQKSALGVCDGYVNNVKIPKKGDKIIVKGPYVIDKQHGWAEIHPVCQIKYK